MELSDQYLISNYVFSVIRKALKSPVELYTKWGLVPEVLNGIHLFDKDLNVSLECYWLKRYPFGTPTNYEMLFEVNDSILLITGNDIPSYGKYLSDKINVAINDIKDLSLDIDKEVFRNIHFYLSIEKSANQDEIISRIDLEVRNLFNDADYYYHIIDNDYGYDFNCQLIGFFNIEMIREKLNNVRIKLEEGPSPFGYIDEKWPIGLNAKGVLTLRHY